MQTVHTILSDKVCQLLTASRWFFLGTPISLTNATDRKDITEILLYTLMYQHTMHAKLYQSHHDLANTKHNEFPFKHSAEISDISSQQSPEK